MTTRPMTGKRLIHSASFTNRKVVPTVSDVHVHSFGVDDRKSISPKSYKEEKLAAGLRANENHDYIEAVRQFSLIKPDTTTSLYLGGCARLELQYYLQTQEAIIDFNKCIELSSQTESSPFRLEVWYKRALAYHNINKHDEAIKDYTEFINQCRSLGKQGESELQRGLIGRGFTYQVMYELDKAMKDMTEANRLTYVNNPYYLCCRASVHVSRNERERALEDLSHANNIGCDKNIEALFQRAIVLAELGRHNAALEDLKKALLLSRKPTQQADICFRSGLSECVLNNKEQAYQWFGQAITLHPYHAQAYYRLGMMQREKGQYKEALKSLNRAHELSPQQGDILLERATVNQHLGKPDDATYDRRRGIQLNSSSFSIITMLGDRIKKIQEEIDRTGATPRTHLELAIAYDGLVGQKKDSKIEYYKLAVIEYRATIQTDTKYLYPQAHALLALCQKKMNHFIQAHESHMEFYNVLSKQRGAIYHWKKYLLDVKDRMEINQIETHLDENAISKLIHMELNRRKKDIDEETFQNDIEDKYKNQLAFYQQMRIDLANVLAAIAVINLDNKNIIDNTEDTANKVSKIVELLSVRETSVPTIELALNSNIKVNSNILRKTDYNMIKMSLKSIGNVGDMTEQLDVAQLVARHLCTRYRLQLICLKPNQQYSNDDQHELIEEKPTSCWNCCGSSKIFSSKQSTYTDKKETIKKISTFAIAFIIHAINNETIKVSSSTKSARKDTLATSLVLIVCAADPNDGRKALSPSRYGNENLPINLTAVSTMLKTGQPPNPDEITQPIEWKLYAFFRAPGIYYHSDNATAKVRYYGLGPSMMPNVYGYRLGTKEEVDVFKKI